MNKKLIMLITGTRKGIGRDLVKYYIKKNYKVIGCSRGNVDYKYNNYEHFTIDVSNEDSVKKMFLSIRKKYHKLDILINNAGLSSMNHVLLTPKNIALEIIETNFMGTFLISREAAKIMKNNKVGRIINITSVGTQMKLEGEAIYTASKSAIENLTIVMSRELSRFGITVNAVGPTPTMTDLIKFVPKEKINNIMKELAFDRLTKIKDITNVIDFFISKKSDYITGQLIFLGGA
jgi:3-oxoacyl-[acyl-carrier protein] reductase